MLIEGLIKIERKQLLSKNRAFMLHLSDFSIKNMKESIWILANFSKHCFVAMLILPLYSFKTFVITVMKTMDA